MRLRQNPHEVKQWLYRVKLFMDPKKGAVKEPEPAKAVIAFTEAVKTIEPLKAVGKPSTVWIEFAKFYEQFDDLENACRVFEKAVKVEFKSVEELAEIVQLAERPFIVQGVMTVKGALKAKQAGAAAIVVSNHGGRVLDQCPATAEVLPEIAAALKGTGVKVLVDGGIRTGVDVFKALALGADGVLICRPFVTAVYGGGAEGVKCYIDKLAGELADTMQMCGAHTLAEITPDMVRV